jgi:hypothetical protein
VFRLFDPSWVMDRWHASDLLVNYIGGGEGNIGHGASQTNSELFASRWYTLTRHPAIPVMFN